MLPVTFRRLSDPSDPGWRLLISLYLDSFEDAERETEAAIIRNFASPARLRPGGHQVIGAFGSTDACVGGVVFSYLPAVECGYLSYLFVNSQFRRQGIATALLREARSILVADAAAAGRPRLVGSFTEIQREGDTASNVIQRLRFWARVGVLPLDLDWHYPPLRPDIPTLRTYLAYGSYGPVREFWFPSDIERVATAIFDATYAYLPQAPAVLAKVIAGLRQMPSHTPIPYLAEPPAAP